MYTVRVEKENSIKIDVKAVWRYVAEQKFKVNSSDAGSNRQQNGRNYEIQKTDNKLFVAGINDHISDRL